MAKTNIFIFLYFFIISPSFGQVLISSQTSNIATHTNLPTQTNIASQTESKLVFRKNISLGNFTKREKIAPSLVSIHKFKNKLDMQDLNLSGIQGFCTDGKFFYIASVTQKTDKYYLEQKTKIIKIDMKTNKIVLQKHIGNIGHCNSLTYNPKTNCIYIPTSSRMMPYIHKFDTDFTQKEKIYLKNKNGKNLTEKNFTTLAYDTINDIYITKFNNKTIGIFNSDLILQDTITCQEHLTINDSMSMQALSCDGSNILSVCSDLRSNSFLNFVLIFDMDGRYLETIELKQNQFPDSIKPEVEQIASFNNDYYILANIGKGRFGIYKINLRENK